MYLKGIYQLQRKQPKLADKSYKEAEDIFLSGGGDTEETYNASDWWMCTEDHNELEVQATA